MSTVATAPQTELSQSTDDREPALPLRGDTLLGVCEAVGQDLRINPAWLRVAFAALLLWNPEVVVACYLGLGIVVAVTRLAFPVTRRMVITDAPAAASQPAIANEQSEKTELLAA